MKTITLLLAVALLSGCAAIRKQNEEIKACMPCSAFLPTDACRAMNKCEAK